MGSNELAAAVERLKAHDSERRELSDEEYIQTLETIIDAVLPEFDETPVDSDWCNGHLEKTSDPTVWKLRDNNVTLEVICGSHVELVGHWFETCGGVSLEINPTRGQVRTLCRALGIQLKEKQ